MKKVFAFILTASLLFAMFAVPVSAADRGHVAPRANITVDGERDAGFGDAYMSLSQLIDIGDGAPGRVWTAWNDNYFFVYAEIMDTTPNHDHFDRFFNNDSIELWFNWDNVLTTGGNQAMDAGGNSRAVTRVTVTAAEHAANPEFSTTIRQNAVNYQTPAHAADIPQFVNVFRGPLNGSYDNGYVVEVQINMARALVSEGTSGTPVNAAPFAAGRQITFEAKTNDNAAGTGRTTQMVTDGFPESRGIEPNFDNLNLVITLGNGDAAPPAATPAPPAATPAPPEETPAPPANGAVPPAPPEPPVPPAPSPDTSDSAAMFFAFGAAGLLALVFVARKKLTA